MQNIKMDLVDAVGRISQDFGMGRIVGQIGMYLYLSKEESSQDDVANDLGLSKASVSLAARHLESLGLVQRVWKRGDRKSYYRMVDHVGLALQGRVTSMIAQRLKTVNMEMDQGGRELKRLSEVENDPDVSYMLRRVNRAESVCRKVNKIMDSPFLSLLSSKFRK